MQRIAEALGVPPEDVKEKNLYEKGQVKIVYFNCLKHSINILFMYVGYTSWGNTEILQHQGHVVT